MDMDPWMLARSPLTPAQERWVVAHLEELSALGFELFHYWGKIFLLEPDPPDPADWPNSKGSKEGWPPDLAPR